MGNIVNGSSELNLKGNDADEHYKNSRTLKEKSLAMQAKLEYEIMTLGNLILRDDVHKAAFKAGRMLRDKLLSMPK